MREKEGLCSFSSRTSGSKKCGISVGRRLKTQIEILYMPVGIDAVTSIHH